MKKLIFTLAIVTASLVSFGQKSTGIKFNTVKTINKIPAQQTVSDTANYSIIMDDENSKQLIVMVWVGGTHAGSFDMVVWNGNDYVDIEDRTKNQVNAAVKAKILAR